MVEPLTKKSIMLDLIWILISGFVVLLLGYVVIEVFRYGANLERRNKRTDLWGRPNNHMSKDDMD